jgi:GTPase
MEVIRSKTTQNILKNNKQIPSTSSTRAKKTLKSKIEDYVKIGVVGNVDSGKSTLVGVLSKGLPDDGRGSARLKVFNYPHEASNGRTSSVAQEIMGFKRNGEQVFASRFVQNKNKYWAEVVRDSDKIVSLIDLCGHEKYLKTTIYGLVGCVPDYVMIIVGANMGLSRMTKEHLGIVLALEIPFFIVMTKVDMVAEETMKKTIHTMNKLMSCSVVNKKAMIVDYENPNELDVAVNALASTKVVPIFKVSNVNQFGIKPLREFIYKLQARNDIKELGTRTDKIEFDIHEKFTVNGVGLVVSGLMKSGTMTIGQNLFLGPDKFNSYKMVQVKSLHFARTPVESVAAGQFCCVGLKALKALKKKEELTKDSIRKGMVLLEASNMPISVRKFEAEVAVLHHSSTIKENYESVMHCGVIRQCVKIVKMDKTLLRTGDKAIITFEFKFSPEYLKSGLSFLLREGRTKILGQVTRVFNAEPKNSK